MAHNLLFGLCAIIFQVFFMQSATAQLPSVNLICSITAEDISHFADFSEDLCRQAKEELARMSGLSVVEADVLPKGEDPWVHLTVSILSPRALRATVEWKTSDGIQASGRVFDAGIDDATLNSDMARMLVSALIKETPYSDVNR